MNLVRVESLIVLLESGRSKQGGREIQEGIQGIIAEAAPPLPARQ